MYSEDDIFDPSKPGNFNSLKRSFLLRNCYLKTD